MIKSHKRQSYKLIVLFLISIALMIVGKLGAQAILIPNYIVGSARAIPIPNYQGGAHLMLIAQDQNVDVLGPIGYVGPASAYPPAGTGVANPAVTQDNIMQTVCVKNWTKTIRPPASYTDKLKLQQMAALSLPGKPGEYEEDHMASLEIGGDPRDPHNLWPEPYAGPYGARTKDQVEDRLHRMLCSGKITLADAQSCIISDWIACGRRIGAIK